MKWPLYSMSTPVSFAHYIAYFYSFWLIFAQFYSLSWLISTHFDSLLLILAHCYSFEKTVPLTFCPSMPRKRPRFIIRAQIGFHTPFSKEQNNTKTKNKDKYKTKTKTRCFLDEKLSQKCFDFLTFRPMEKLCNVTLAHRAKFDPYTTPGTKDMFVCLILRFGISRTKTSPR